MTTKYEVEEWLPEDGFADEDDGWVLVKFASDCQSCNMCDEPLCAECGVHYADCSCPGPHQEDEYKYKEINGILYARKLVEED